MEVPFLKFQSDHRLTIKALESVMLLFHNNYVDFTCGSSPANVAYAKAWGMTVSPTVIPAIKSATALLELYSGSHFEIGSLLCINLLNFDCFLERCFDGDDIFAP